MKLPQFPLAKAMAFIVALAVGLLALRTTSVAGPSRWSRITASANASFMRDVWTSQVWASATFTMTVSVLSLSGAGVIIRRGHKRAFWIAFFLGGWGCLLLAFGPLVRTSIPQSIVGLLVNPLPESDVLVWGVIKETSIPLDFAQVTFSLGSLAVAYLSGVIASCIFDIYGNVPARVTLRGDAKLVAGQE
jgi:hypothetical protein